MIRKIIATATTAIALALMASAAQATCGVNGYWGAECGTPPSTTNTNTNTAGAVAGAVGVGTGIGVGTGGNATSTATGGRGGNAVATGGQGGHGGRATSGSVSGVTGSGNSTSSSGAAANNSVMNRIDASTRIRHSAASAIAPQLNGYGMANCWGDTNPSGSFSAGLQTFGWGVTAGSSKASNVCAVYAVGGPAAAAAYLAAMDPNAHRALVAAGVVTTRARVKAGAVEAAPRVRVTCPATHPVYVEGKGCRK